MFEYFHSKFRTENTHVRCRVGGSIFVRRATVFEVFSVSAKHARENLHFRILSDKLCSPLVGNRIDKMYLM